jgi:molecular chaperone DnaK (HSP70)
LIEIAASYNYAYSSLTSAVIAVPAEFSAEQRIATVDAFKLAGIKVTRILEEPTAAALAYGLDQKEGVEHILVYDFGGGTLDISVLRVSPDGFVDVIGSSGDSELGGVDFDIHVADYLLEKEKDALLEGDGHTKCDVEVGTHLCTETSIRTMSERMKIKLSQLQDGSEDQKVSVQEECLTISKDQAIGDNDVCKSLVSHTINLTLEEYDQSVSELYDRSVLPIRDVLKDLDMKPEDIDEVVMVGGTTRMPQIRKLIKEEFSGVIEDLNTQIDPDLTVAYGAASVID